MKLISWNVNGLRACLTHDFAASFAALDADIFSVQETKMQPGQADFALRIRKYMMRSIKSVSVPA